jgi:hypothetical protein
LAASSSPVSEEPGTWYAPIPRLAPFDDIGELTAIGRRQIDEKVF